jgi:hypothetical protein
MYLLILKIKGDLMHFVNFLKGTFSSTMISLLHLSILPLTSPSLPLFISLLQLSISLLNYCFSFLQLSLSHLHHSSSLLHLSISSPISPSLPLTSQSLTLFISLLYLSVTLLHLSVSHLHISLPPSPLQICLLHPFPAPLDGADQRRRLRRDGKEALEKKLLNRPENNALKHAAAVTVDPTCALVVPAPLDVTDSESNGGEWIQTAGSPMAS